MEWLVFPPGGGLSVTKGRSKLSWWQHPKWKEGLSLLERSGCCATGEKHHEHLFNRNFSFVWREGHWRNCWKTPEEHVRFISNHLLKGSQAELFSTCGVSISAMSVINRGPSKGVEIPKNQLPARIALKVVIGFSVNKMDIVCQKLNVWVV